MMSTEPGGTPEADYRVVLDASALVDLLAGTEKAAAVRVRLARTVLHAPAHLDVEVVSALGRLVRSGDLDPRVADTAVGNLRRMSLTRHELGELIPGAWRRCAYLRVSDAFYVELADRLHMPLVTTDPRLARAVPGVEAITG